jgi:fatty-acyl-CoA synthase
MCAYGLAEATLAVTAIGRDEAPSDLTLDGFALADGVVEDSPSGAAGAVHLRRQAARGVLVALSPHAEGSQAEIRVRSDSLASGYFGDPERACARFPGCELLTDDLGSCAMASCTWSGAWTT